MKTPKLNKSQLLEFEASNIFTEYAQQNFANVTKQNTRELLGVRDAISERLKGTALLGGWVDYAQSVFKPKQPRTSQGKLVKYESLTSPKLVEVKHPSGSRIEPGVTYVGEGFKKAVAIAQVSGCKTFGFNGLSQGIALVDEINALDGDVRILLDNDNTLGAINVARSFVAKLHPDIKIGCFRGFKGIDDAFVAGVTLDQIKFVRSAEWSANYAGYISGKQYTFHKPQFEEIEIPANVPFVSVLGGKGTGKTWFMEYLAKKQIESRNIHVITHRIVLSRANAKRLAIPYIDDESYESGSVGLCIDSLMKLKLSDFVGATLFIDEITQVVDHLINSSTLRHKRAVIVKRLQEILLTLSETGGMLIVADADIDAKSLQFLKALGSIPDDKCFSIQNTFVFKKGFALHTYGVHKATNSGISERLFPVDVVKKIRDAALDGKRLFCCLSAQTEEATYSTQTVEAYLISKGVPESDICRIDSDTIGDPEAKAYKAAERINELCASYKYILASPTLNTGADIQYWRFNYVIGIATGVLSSNSVRQFLGRPRNWEIERIIYAPEQKQTFQETSLTNFSDLELYKKAHSDALQCFDEAWFNEFDSQKQKLIEATTSYFLNASHEAQRDRFEYATRIKQGLLLEGYQVAEFESDCDPNEAAEIYKELKFHSEALTLQKYLGKQESPQIDEDEAKALRSQIGLPKEEQYKLDAYTIREQLNVEPTVEVQKALFEGKKEQLENNFAALDGSEISKQLWQKADYWARERQDLKEVTSDFVRRNLRVIRIEALKRVDFFNRIQTEFNKVEAQNIISDLLREPLNHKIFNLPKEAGEHSIKSVASLAKKFNFKIVQTRKTESERFYTGSNQGFVLSDGTDLKPSIFEYWTEKRQKQVDNWQDFKTDFKLVKCAVLLDESKHLPNAITSDWKYTKLATRARTVPLPEMPKYRMVDAFSANDFVSWLRANPEIAIDIETYGEGKKGGLNHLTGNIRLIQFSCWDAVWLLEKSDFDLVREQLKALFLNPEQRKIGHNFMFDLRFLRKEFDVIPSNCADTMLGSRCLMGDLGAAKITSHSLKGSCENFLGLAMDKTEQKSDWGGTLTTSQIEYAAADTWNTFALYKRLEELCKDPSKLLLPFPKMMAWEAWELENKFLFAAQLMEATGYEIDVPALNDAIVKYTAVRDGLLAKWDLPCTPTQKAQIKKYLSEKYKIPLKSINKATAADHTDIPEILLMQQICGCNAFLLQLAAIEKQVGVNNGRVTTIFKTLTGTGRTSTGATGIDKMLINLQSLAARVNPALKGFDLSKLKSVFKTHLIIDLPNSHGRISAELSGDEQHLEGYLDSSIDMHCITAAAVAEAVFPGMGYTAEWIKANKDTDPIAKGLRDTAKNTYYGWLNGAGAARIQEQIKSNLQIDANFNACKKALEGLQTLFAKTTEYGKEKLKELEANQFIVNGIICGWLEVAGTYLSWTLGAVGGNYRVPATKAFACLWSRAESLLMKRSCIRISEKFEATPEWEAKLQNFIHDEVNCEIGHPDAATFAHSVVREEFERICPRTVVGFDPLTKCYPLQNWGQK